MLYVSSLDFYVLCSSYVQCLVLSVSSRRLGEKAGCLAPVKRLAGRIIPLELHLTTSELWFGQEQEGILS